MVKLCFVGKRIDEIRRRTGSGSSAGRVVVLVAPGDHGAVEPDGLKTGL